MLSRHGTVVAYLALVLASSGVAYAAATVGSAEVVNNSLKSIDLKDGYAVKGVDVIDDSLTGADIAEVTLQGMPHAATYQQRAELDAPPVRAGIARVGPWTIKAECEAYSAPSRGELRLRIFVNGPGRGGGSLITQLGGDPAVPVAAGGRLTEGSDIMVVDAMSPQGETGLGGSMTMQSNGIVARFDFQALLAMGVVEGDCSIDGTVTLAV